MTRHKKYDEANEIRNKLEAGGLAAAIPNDTADTTDELLATSSDAEYAKCIKLAVGVKVTFSVEYDEQKGKHRATAVAAASPRYNRL